MIRPTKRSKILLAGFSFLLVLGIVALGLGKPREHKPRVGTPRIPIPHPPVWATPAPPAEALAAVTECPPKPGKKFATGALSFRLKFKDEVNPYCVIGVFVLPGESMDLEAVLGPSGSAYTAEAKGGKLEARGKDGWRWKAPAKPGLYPIRIAEKKSGEVMTVNAFVMVPYHGEETLSGYRIGHYQRKPLRNDPAYKMPVGFIEITQQNKDTWLSPHFQLKQFWCKQSDKYPSYVTLRERLLLKLEMVLERANQRGWRTDTFFVMSAFRTPHYNKAIGNTTIYSRHSYGDASDIFIDRDKDGVMDDLDGNGRIDFADGKKLYDMIDSMSPEAAYKPFEGGLHVYPPTPSHGPMVHVDVRGNPSRW